MVEVMGFGQCCLDYLALADEYPPEDRKAEFRALLIQGGGPVATAMVCLSRLGRRTALAGVVGDDPFGQEIRAGLEAEGVDTGGLVTRPGASSQFAFILANPVRSTRTIHWIRGTGEPLREDQLPAELISRAKVLHLDGLDPAGSPKAAAMARRAGVQVTLDVGTLRDHTLDLIRRVDHTIASEVFKEAFAPDLEPREAVRKLHALGPEAAVITMGRAGSVGFDGQETIYQPAFPVRAVDTTAAGDAYNGGYIHALLQGWSLRRRMRYASAVAALNCTALGGRTALPTREEVDRFLESNPGVQAGS